MSGGEAASRPCVFLGPSLDLASARLRLDADYRPPAAQGDVYAAVQRGARVIGLVDGVFQDAPAVWHTEVLWALSRGVHVLGAASMGALRAAELHRFGMRGVGEVFADYAAGRLDADDAVAVVHGPAEMGFAASTVSLVDILATCESAREVGVLDARAAAGLAAAARALPFTERRFDAVLRVARDAAQRDDGIDLAVLARFEAYLEHGARSVKRDDALALLDAIAGLPASPHRASFTLADTPALRVLRAGSGRDAGDGLPSAWAAVLDELRLDPARLRALGARAGSVRDGALLEALRDGAEFDRLGTRAESKRRVLLRTHGALPGFADALRTPHDAHRWYFEQRLGQPLPVDLDAYAQEVGFASVAALNLAVLHEQLFVEAGGEPAPLGLGASDTAGARGGSVGMVDATERTRFSLFAQPAFLAGFERPVTIRVAVPIGEVRAGPCDDRIRVVDARDKSPYGAATRGPPYRGPLHPPATPDARGHFDHLEPGTRVFRAAHAYAGLRFVLDTWERYSGARVRWWFAPARRRLEVVPDIDWPNGHAGHGFIELGHGGDSVGRPAFAENLDVLAHEMSHVLLLSEAGFPRDLLAPSYAAFQEGMADAFSMVAVLQLESVVEHVLERTRGNLYASNELNRLAELSPMAQVRTASHALRADALHAATTAAPLDQRALHRLGMPLTGALFDILVEVFHAFLVEQGAISAALDASVQHGDQRALGDAAVQHAFDAAYARAPDVFAQALRRARDHLGLRIVAAVRRMAGGDLTPWAAAVSFLRVDREFSGLRYQRIARECLAWRRFSPTFHGTDAATRSTQRRRQRAIASAR